MTIAEKLIRIAENLPAKHKEAQETAYNHGYNDGDADGYRVGYGEGYETGHDNGYKAGHDGGHDEGYNQGYDEGRQAERDAFWDAFQGANRRHWENAFQDKSWNDTTFFPKYDIKPNNQIAGALFRYCGITDLEGRLNECGVTLDTSGATSLNNAFAESLLTTVPALDIRNCVASNAFTSAFAGCRSLKTIRKIITNAGILYDRVFQNCPLLKNITFEGVIGQNIDFSSCTKLSWDSITSTVNALSDTAEGKTLTLSKIAVDNAFMHYIGEGVDPVLGTDESNPYWWDLIATKPNWTITLV